MSTARLKAVQGEQPTPHPSTARGGADEGEKRRWFLYDRRDRKGQRRLVLRYREGPGRWRDKRVPASRAGDDATAELYAVEFVAELGRERARQAAERQNAAGPTFRDFAERWVTGTLAREFPDHVREKASAKDDRARLDRYIYPQVADVPIKDFALADAERVMRALPADLATATRRQVAQVLSRVLNLAAYPANLRGPSPLPRGFLPVVKKRKAEAWLYPDEEAQLAGCTAVPLTSRLLYAFLAREGMRISEALGLDWGDIDLDRGVVRLDKNKTDDPRAWALDPGVTRALASWQKRYRKGAQPVDPVFIDAQGERMANGVTVEAVEFREHLRMAGVTRAELFEGEGQRLRATRGKQPKTAPREEGPPAGVRLPIRLHDLRATFVTVSLATGRTERWVKDRTGHKSSVMVDRYARSARTQHEIGAGPMRPMDEAIPELRNPPAGAAGAGGCSPRSASGSRSRGNRAKGESPPAGKETGSAAQFVAQLVAPEQGEGGISVGKANDSAGGPSGTRTRDLRIKSPQLYRLSYQP